MSDTPLGKQTDYEKEYSSDSLFAIPRENMRSKLGFDQFEGRFEGSDYWNAYEFSWLKKNGAPASAILQIVIFCNSKNIVESKSLKLYLNSFSFKRFDSSESLLNQLKIDLENCVEGEVKLSLQGLEKEKEGASASEFFSAQGDYICLDHQIDKLPEECFSFDEVNTSQLQVNNETKTAGTKTFYTHLFRSLCPVTGQPDWASIFIRYQGREISEEGLLLYLLSFRKHQGFHEDCVENIYKTIFSLCEPEKLSVYAAFTRRGGIDINPFRSNFESEPSFGRVLRQ